MRVDELERELRDERPAPEHEFARRLDEWAADGFPRDRGLGPRASGSVSAGTPARARKRLSSIPPRRLLMPIGAAATLFVVVGIAITGGSGSGEEETSGSLSSGDASAESETSAGALKEVPESTVSNEASPEAAADAGTGAAEAVPDAAPGATDLRLAQPPGGTGVARGTDDRIVDATARVTLGAEAGEVQEVANHVVEVTDRYRGVVLDSQVATDQAGARAAFTLEIPYKRLDAALADLSGLADVISRSEAGEDITARAVRAQKNLADVLEQVRKARIELIQADSRERRLIIKARIGSLEARANALEAERNDVERQGRLATVNVEITSEGSGSDDGNWTLGDALGDAGRVIEVIGGIALVSLAVLFPAALVGAMVWLIATAVRNRGRERALDE